MELDQFAGGTPPFITLDACDGDLAEAVLTAIEAHTNGNSEEWTKLIKKNGVNFFPIKN